MQKPKKPDNGKDRQLYLLSASLITHGSYYTPMNTGIKWEAKRTRASAFQADYEGSIPFTPHLDEEAIKRLFVSAVNKLLADKDEIIANFEAVRGELFSTDALEAEAKELQSEMAIVAELIQKCIEENARVALDQREYQERYDALVGRFDKAKARFEEATALVSETKARGETVDGFIAELARDGLLAEFDERLWHTLVDYATVYSENDVSFTFKDGTEIKA